MSVNLAHLLKPIVVGLALIAVIAVGQKVTNASTVTYITSGSFNGGGSSITFGSGANLTTITFTGVSSTVDATQSTFASLGQFQTAVSGDGATITPGATFSLNITQTVPSSGSGALPGELFGTVLQNQSRSVVNFSTSFTHINTVFYYLISDQLVLVPPATNNGVTTVQADIIPTPEPATILLLSTGLAGAAGLVRRRRGKAPASYNAPSAATRNLPSDS